MLALSSTLYYLYRRMNKNYTLNENFFVKIQGGTLILLRGGVMDCHPHPLKPPRNSFTLVVNFDLPTPIFSTCGWKALILYKKTS